MAMQLCLVELLWSCSKRLHSGKSFLEASSLSCPHRKKVLFSLAAAAFTFQAGYPLSLIHISEPTRLGIISYAVFCLKKKKNNLLISHLAIYHTTKLSKKT